MNAPQRGYNIYNYFILPVSLHYLNRSWSYNFGLASNTVYADKTVCDMIMLKCNKYLCSFKQ